MELWHFWTSLLLDGMTQICAQFGFSQAMAIITMTLLVRAGLMPFSLTAALRMEANKVKLRAVKPELEALRSRHKGKPRERAEATAELYRRHDIRMLDRIALANVGSQSMVGLGLYQAIGRSGFDSPFMWITSLARPDAWLTAAVAVLMAIAMAIAPGAFAEPSMIAMMSVAIVVAVVAVAAMPAGVGVYWAASNVASAVQALLVRLVLARRPAA
ncbi:hypothetical protein BH09PSE6_BH09PSE6_11370 [soil metagenome]